MRANDRYVAGACMQCDRVRPPRLACSANNAAVRRSHARGRGRRLTALLSVCPSCGSCVSVCAFLFFFHAKAARIVMASSAAAAAAASASTAVAIASTPSDVLAATSDEPGVKGAIRIINVPSAQAPDASCAPYGPPNRKMAFALRGIEDPSGKHQ